MDYRRKSLLRDEQDQRYALRHNRIYLSFAGSGDAPNADGLLNDDRVTMWWDEDRIQATVNREFILAQLTPDEQRHLDDTVSFGDCLTASTYFHWIETKAKRIFLILVELGLPEQIFGVIDDSWDDDDLPIPLDQVERLQLTFNRDMKVEKRFFQKQFFYLLKSLNKGDHIKFDDFEIIPFEPADKRPVSAVLQTNVDKVNLPGRPDDIFLRRKVPIGVASGCVKQENFLSAVKKIKDVEHRHLTNIWASYQQHQNAYLLLTPVFESTLKSFLTVNPQSYKIMPKSERRVMLLNWLYCLSEGLSYLHSKGLSHGNIKPSNIMLDIDNNIYFGETSMIPECTSSGEKKGFDQEAYNYAAPEEKELPSTSAPQILRTTARKHSINNKPRTSPTSPTFPASERVFSMSSPPKSPPAHNYAPKSDPRMADIFCLGTIFLEILTCLMKRTSRSFASHRASKNKTPGRGGGLPDSSFHKNIRQVLKWVDMLIKDATKKEDNLFLGIREVLILALDMLSILPTDRPTAKEVSERLKSILTSSSGLSLDDLHCMGPHIETPPLEVGFDELRLASQRAAAEACALTAATGVPVIGSTPPVMTNEMMYEQFGVRSPGYHSEYQMSSTIGSMELNGHSDRTSTSTIANSDFTRIQSFNTTNSSSNRSSSNKDTNSTTSGRDRSKSKAKAQAWKAPIYGDFNFG